MWRAIEPRVLEGRSRVVIRRAAEQGERWAEVWAGEVERLADRGGELADDGRAILSEHAWLGGLSHSPLRPTLSPTYGDHSLSNSLHSAAFAFPSRLVGRRLLQSASPFTM